jgi:hypothetical protein
MLGMIYIRIDQLCSLKNDQKIQNHTQNIKIHEINAVHHVVIKKSKYVNE